MKFNVSSLHGINKNFFASKYAIRSISRRKSKNIAGIIAIALGVTLFVGVSTGTSGLERGVGAALWNGLGDVDVSVLDLANGYFLADVIDVIETSTDPALNDLITVSPMLMYTSVPFYFDGDFTREGQVLAIDPSKTAGYRDFLDLNGNPLDLSQLLAYSGSTNPAIISKTMAEKMNIQVGELVSSTLQTGNGEVTEVEYLINAIYDDTVGRGLEYKFSDNPILYTNLQVAQSVLIHELAGMINQLDLVFSGIDKNFDNFDVPNQDFGGKQKLEDAVNKITELTTQSGYNLHVWSGRVDISVHIAEAVENMKFATFFFTFLLNVTALLLIINIQSMSFQDRRYQTAVLRSIGSTRSTILRVFLIEAGLIGILGSLIGLGFGILYGNWIGDKSASIFGVKSEPAEFSAGIIIGSFLLGILLSVLTAVLPAWKSASQPIASELRGLEPTKMKKEGRKTLMIGSVLFFGGLSIARNAGKFYQKEGWAFYEDQTTYLLAFGLTLFGLGFLLTLIIPRKLAINISAFSIWVLAVFGMLISIDWAEDGEPDIWFTVVFVYLLIGSGLILSNNFDSIMRWLNSFFMNFQGVRPVSQVSSTQLIGKKTRATLVFTIFTLIMTLNIAIATGQESTRSTYVDQFDWRSYGNDIQVTTEAIPIDQMNIATEIAELDTVEHVYAFRSAIIPLYLASPDSVEFDPTIHIKLVRAVEISPEIINPDNDWHSENAFPISFEVVSEKAGYNLKDDPTAREHRETSGQILEDIFNGRQRSLDGVDHIISVGNVYPGEVGVYPVLGKPMFLRQGENFVPMTYEGDAYTFMGDWGGFYGSLLISEETSSMFTEFDSVLGPNLFLVKSSNGYADKSANNELAHEIEVMINDLSNPASLSSELGYLIGASTKIIEKEMRDYFSIEANFVDFLSTFALFGLIIGGAGLGVIAIRSVSERTREIGMMRAIGFSRRSVIYSVLYELLVIGVIGLVSGIFNAVFMTEMYWGTLVNITPNYPVGKMFGFGFIIIGMTLLAAILPSIKASRIAPSQALRYTG